MILLVISDYIFYLADERGRAKMIALIIIVAQTSTNTTAKAAAMA